MDTHTLYESQLPLLRDVIDFICWKNKLTVDEGEDFKSWVLTRVVESDYAIFKKFEGRSSLRTYLIISIRRMLLDYRDQKWGKFRPSAAAIRQGDDAVLLERYIYRDGMPIRDAISTVRDTHGSVRSETELLNMVGELRVRRFRPRTTSLDDFAHELAEKESASTALNEVDEDRQLAGNAAALKRALSELGAADRVILVMHRVEQRKLCDIAKAFGRPQKQFYREYARIEKRLKTKLLAHGLDGSSRRLASARVDWGENLLKNAVSAEDRQRVRIGRVDREGA